MNENKIIMAITKQRIKELSLEIQILSGFPFNSDFVLKNKIKNKLREELRETIINCYNTDDKTYIENGNGQCIARFCENSYEFYKDGELIEHKKYNGCYDLKTKWKSFKRKTKNHYGIKIKNSKIPKNIKNSKRWFNFLVNL